MSQELQVREKREVESQAEQTRNIPVFLPAVDIFESEEGLTLIADMPGVEANGLKIDLKNNVLSIRGETKSSETNQNVIYREYQVGDYFRNFTLSEIIDQKKISANLKDGVLTLELPKAEKAKPRQIEVKAE